MHIVYYIFTFLVGVYCGIVLAGNLEEKICNLNK